MKKPQPKAETASRRLSKKQLREVEQKLGVFFVEPKNPTRGLEEQYGVLDEDEVYVGDVRAPHQQPPDLGYYAGAPDYEADPVQEEQVSFRGDCFDMDSLAKAVRELFDQPPLSDRRGRS